MSDDFKINFTREAFFHPGNLTFLLGATLAAFFAGGSGPLAQWIFTVAFGLELVYLGTVPRLPGFQKQMKLRKVRERSRLHEEKDIFNRLSDTSQKRFLVLKHLSTLIKDNFEKMTYATQGMLDNINKKIEGLLSNYLVNLELLQRYENFLNNASQNTLQAEIKSLRKEIEGIDAPKLKEIKERRLAILLKRFDKFDKSREKYQICESQLETIEDAIRYIYEKSMTMSSPDEIGFQLDNLISDLEETAQMMEDLEDDLPPTYNVLQQLEELDIKDYTTGKSPEKVKE